MEILSNVDEIVCKSRESEIEFFEYDKDYNVVMKKRNELESLMYIKYILFNLKFYYYSNFKIDMNIKE